jgi:hypothetical protein
MGPSVSVFRFFSRWNPLLVPLLEHAQQWPGMTLVQGWDPRVPIVEQNLDLWSHSCKNDLRSLLKDIVAQQWPVIIWVQEWPKEQKYHQITLVYQRPTWCGVRGAIPPLPPCVSMACSGTPLPLPLLQNVNSISSSQVPKMRYVSRKYFILLECCGRTD